MWLRIRRLAFLCLYSFPVLAQPTADFSANPQSGCSPLLVNFSDHSAGNPTYWKWDLGNGTISYLQNPSVTYFNPGAYNVSLTVRNASGSNSITKRQFITIYALPTANFFANARTGCLPSTIQFFDSSIAGSGNIVSRLWDFGDGTLSTLINPQHTYLSAGSYHVSLRVTTDAGCSKSITKSFYINIFESVRSNFSNSAQTTCAPPALINFTNMSTGTGTLQYSWNFGDGSVSTDMNPVHTYRTAGSFTITLITRNVNGCADTLVRSNAITIRNTRAAFNSGTRTCINSPVMFNNISTPTNANFIWNFGDGTTSTSANPQHIFPAAGSYNVKLVIISGTCSDSITNAIRINQKPTASFATNDTSSCKAPFTVIFRNESVGGTSYSWNFGDGTTSTQSAPTHTYLREGLFTVRLIVTNSSGCTDTLIRNQLIKIVPPVASIDNMPQMGCAPFTWTFNSRLISTEPALSYLWDFGDSTTSTDANPTHIFNAGLYKVKLIVITASGCSDTVIIVDAIRATIKPTANFTGAPLNICADTKVNFNDQSTGDITRWSWNFGDGGNSTSQNPQYQYSDTGYFAVTLVVYNYGCGDTLIRQNYVHVNPPIAIINHQIDCINKFRRVFTGSNSIGAETYFWNFGDGTTSSDANPVHTYGATGLYDVTLTVRNISFGCESKQKITISIINEFADFMASDTIVCRNNPVNFSAINSNPANIVSYNWNFGDGISAITSSTISHSYTSAGSYNVRLIINDAIGCKDTMNKLRYILVNGPTANFSTNVAGTCRQVAVNFSDSSRSDGRNPISSWTMDYGDGTIQTYNSPGFSHAYSSAGNYTISLTVRDSSGCADIKSIRNLITISKPVASFGTRDTLVCPGRTVTFVNNSTGPGLIYNWTFGDGNSSTAVSPVYNYAADGYYSVSLKITDQYGCTDSLIRTNYIHLVTGRASFTMSDSASNCPPLVVTFNNTSIQTIEYNWDFGDGNYSQMANPSHFYGSAGTYVVTLSARGSGGCITTFQKTIIIKGPSGSFSYSPLSGCNPLQVTFEATTINRDQIIWDFSDGTTQTTQDSLTTHIYVTPGKYLPKLILRNNAGCQVAITGHDTIFVQGTEAGFNFNTPVFCNTGTAQFNNTSISSDGIAAYNWQFGDGTTATASNPSHTYNLAGTFYPTLVVTSTSGCKDSIKSITPIKISESPRVVIIRSPNACAPASVNFNSYIQNPDTSAISWQWDFANGQTFNGQNPGDKLFSNAGEYNVKVIVSNSFGCKDTANTIVASYEIPVVSAGADVINCYRRGVSLLATGAATYSWSAASTLSCNNCPNPIANPDSARQYIVTGTTTHGCVNRDSVFVKVNYPFEISVSKPDTLCNGESVVMYAAGTYSYSWTPSVISMGNNNTVVRVNPSTTTVYQVTGTDDAHCFTNTKDIKLTVFPIPSVDAGIDKTINVGNTIELIPVISSDVTEVIWSPTACIARSSYPSILVKPRETTEFLVEVSNPGGCVARDNVTVFVTCDGANVFIPNTFTPNGDGMNDVFYPRGSGLFNIKTMKIFNRWGEVMFQRADFSPNATNGGWNGRYKEQLLNPDVYVYVIEIVCDNNTTLIYKGNVTLLK